MHTVEACLVSHWYTRLIHGSKPDGIGAGTSTLVVQRLRMPPRSMTRLFLSASSTEMAPAASAILDADSLFAATNVSKRSLLSGEEELGESISAARECYCHLILDNLLGGATIHFFHVRSSLCAASQW
jgi:hypothetical protein